MKFSRFDEIIRFAIDNEEEAVKAYGDMSERAQMPGLKELLLELQKEEKKHKKLLQPYRPVLSVEAMNFIKRNRQVPLDEDQS